MFIELTRGLVTQINDDDFGIVDGRKWYAQEHKGHTYAVTPVVRKDGNRRLVGMHRFLLDAQPGEVVDHINGNGLDNRRENLRIATTQQNCANQQISAKPGKSSRFKGVAWDKRRKVWITQIRVNYKLRYLGTFDSETDAAHAYDQAAIEHFGEFAHLNFPEIAHG